MLGNLYELGPVKLSDEGRAMPRAEMLRLESARGGGGFAKPGVSLFWCFSFVLALLKAFQELFAIVSTVQDAQRRHIQEKDVEEAD